MTVWGALWAARNEKKTFGEGSCQGSDGGHSDVTRACRSPYLQSPLAPNKNHAPPLAPAAACPACLGLQCGRRSAGPPQRPPLRPGPRRRGHAARRSLPGVRRATVRGDGGRIGVVLLQAKGVASSTGSRAAASGRRPHAFRGLHGGPHDLCSHSEPIVPHHVQRIFQVELGHVTQQLALLAAHLAPGIGLRATRRAAPCALRHSCAAASAAAVCRGVQEAAGGHGQRHCSLLQPQQKLKAWVALATEKRRERGPGRGSGSAGSPSATSRACKSASPRAPASRG